MTTAPRYFVFLRLGTNFRPDDRNDVYLSAIGTLGHKWGRTTTSFMKMRLGPTARRNPSGKASIRM